MNPTFKFKSEIQLWQGKAAWHFIIISKKLSLQIKGFEEKPRKGFGSMPVQVNVGKSQWKTSIFPKDGTYLLPIKALIRKNEKISAGDRVEVELTLQ
jgi:hypothetical protein